MRTVVVSGGFDPWHLGHLEFFKRARQLGDQLAVIVETDEFVARKHPVLQPQYDRCKMIQEVRGVAFVVANNKVEDCADRVLEIRERFADGGPTVYAVGTDHASGDFPEYERLRAAGVVVEVVPTSYGDRRSSKMLQRATNPYNNPTPMVVVALEAAWGDGVLVCTRVDNGKAELPGGFVEAGETLEQAARREVAEELGVTPKFVRYMTSLYGKYRDGRLVVVAAFRGLLPERPRVPTAEVADCRLVTQLSTGPQEWDTPVDEAVLARALEGR